MQATIVEQDQPRRMLEEVKKTLLTYEVEFKNYTLPEEVDWRSKNIISPVIYQGTCGSCWAITAAQSLEAAYAIKNKKLVQLSY